LTNRSVLEPIEIRCPQMIREVEVDIVVEENSKRLDLIVSAASVRSSALTFHRFDFLTPYFGIFIFSVCAFRSQVCITDGEASGNEDHDITDEHARLLHSGIILKPNAHRNVGRFNQTLTRRGTVGGAVNNALL
jgi:hypothetical protein